MASQSWLSAIAEWITKSPWAILKKKKIITRGHQGKRDRKQGWDTGLIIIIIIIIIIYPLTARVVGAPQMILHPVFSIFSLFSTALWDLANSRPVHSLMLSSHLFLCQPCLLPPFTVPCKMVLARPIQVYVENNKMAE